MASTHIKRNLHKFSHNATWERDKVWHLLERRVEAQDEEMTDPMPSQPQRTQCSHKSQHTIDEGSKSQYTCPTKPHGDKIAKQQDKELLVDFQRQVALKFHFQLLWLEIFWLKLKNMTVLSLNQHKHRGQKLQNVVASSMNLRHFTSLKAKSMRTWPGRPSQSHTN